MEGTSGNIHHGSYLSERTPSKIPSGTYTMEVTSWNLHHGSYLKELPPRKLPSGLTPWKFLHGMYTMKDTS